ncbi:hypothetical protein [Hyphomicrobium sp.]|jgi:hypothetical protein|uniref:hypothetical protein n=1 Tax=Hyphomicrobium sp. TaxID=82 RepID=UPI0035693EB3
MPKKEEPSSQKLSKHLRRAGGEFTAEQIATIEKARVALLKRHAKAKAMVRQYLAGFDQNSRDHVLKAMLDLGIESQISLLGEDEAQDFLGIVFQRVKRELRGRVN